MLPEEIVRCLPQALADKDKPDNEGKTAMHLAAIDDHVEVDNEGQTAMHWLLGTTLWKSCFPC